MLAVVWANEFVNDEGPNDPDFDGMFAANEQVARQIVNRAIDDWNAILDTNIDQDNNPLTGPDLELTILADDLGPEIRGDALPIQVFGSAAAVNGFVPATARIRLDNDAGGTGWFFDQTPLDDAEFTGIADTFQGGFIDASAAGQAAQNDLYRTVLHEIGHSLGAVSLTDLSSGNFAATFKNTPDNPTIFNAVGAAVPAQTVDILLGNLQYVGPDQSSNAAGFRITDNPDGSAQLSGNETAVIDELWQYTFRDGSGRTVTLTESGGGHWYEGPVNSNTPNADQHPNELMNSGRTVPSGGGPPIETTRQFISDLTAEMLADAYGYNLLTPPSELYSDLADDDPFDGVVVPEFLPENTYSFGTSHIVFDAQGTLLVQGLAQDPTNSGNAVNDTISLDFIDGGNSDPSDDLLRIEVAYTVGGDARTITRRVHANRVERLLIAGNGGTDIVAATGAFEAAFGTLVGGENRLVKAIDFVVSSNEDALEAVGQSTSDGVIDLDDVVPGAQVTLRAAVQEANNGAGTQAIYLAPNPGSYELTRTVGSEASNATTNDLDITGDVTIVGAGAGLSVIDADFGTVNAHTRVFEVTAGGDLTLTRLTVSGGMTSSVGGGIRNNGGVLALDAVAIVNNTSGATAGVGSGGGLHNAGALSIHDSVVAENTAGNTGGGVYANGSSTVKIGSSVLANNSSGSGYADLQVSAGGSIDDWGYNLVEHGDSSALLSSLGNLLNPTGGVDFVVTDPKDRIETNDDNYATSLREAVQQANIGGGKIWAPAWEFDLTLQGGGNLSGDIDIVNNVTIEGVGPGYTVVDAASLGERMFEVNGGNRSLAISRLTLTGGTSTSMGAAIYANGASLDIDFSAIVNHAASNAGGAVRLTNSSADVRRSVFTNNVSGTSGGAIFATGAATTLTVEDTLFANNAAANYPNVRIVPGALGVTDGGNLTDDNAAGFFNPTIDAVVTGGADLVANSARDRFRPETDPSDPALSVREAINHANSASSAQELWLPAWDFVLTLDRGMNSTDTDVSYGDLDIKNSLTIRGISGTSAQTSVSWRAGVVDAVFDLLGDYNGDGISDGSDDGTVDAADYTVWRNTLGLTNDLRADGDDDGVVDQDDYGIWVAFHGNTLSLLNI